MVRFRTTFGLLVCVYLRLFARLSRVLIMSLSPQHSSRAAMASEHPVVFHKLDNTPGAYFLGTYIGLV